MPKTCQNTSKLATPSVYRSCLFLAIASACLLPMVFFAGCIFGSVVGISIFAITRNRYMAFGPYLALGAAIMLFWSTDAFWLATDWWPRFLTGLFGFG